MSGQKFIKAVDKLTITFIVDNCIEWSVQFAMIWPSKLHLALMRHMDVTG